MKGNRGEWGEPYVALHLLAYGKLFMADADGNINEDEWMDIIDVIRHEANNRVVKYHLCPDNDMINISVCDMLVTSSRVSEFVEITEALKNEIKNGRGRTFNVSTRVKDFLNRIEMYALKAKSINKSDIFLTVSDPRNSVVREKIGFSIKTKFGHNPTLFNTAPASGVVYKLDNMNDELMHLVNSLVDDKGHAAVSERCKVLREKGCKFEFIGFPIAARAQCEAFRENLELINPLLPCVIERILWNHFFEGDTKVMIPDVVKRIINENPLKLSRPEVKYPYMIKAFLYASYSGMTASTLWDGKGEVNGGFITVGDSGEVLANYALESENFKDYLYNTCYLEFPSTGSKHGDYAKVYKKENGYFYNLNFQIRIS